MSLGIRILPVYNMYKNSRNTWSLKRDGFREIETCLLATRKKMKHFVRNRPELK